MAAIPDRRWYFTSDVLLNSPSRKCQIEPEKELSYRQQAANLIQDMGQRLQVYVSGLATMVGLVGPVCLKKNQLCINTAIVYMHRFYVFHSFQKFPRNSIAAAALFLAAKVEEQPHKLEYVIKVHHACVHRGGPVLDTKSDAYLQQAQELVINESILLQTLGFEVAVDHPHTHVVKCTQMIRASKDLAQTSYFMATNSLHLTTFCLQYKPTVVACICIYLVAKWSQWEIMKSSDGKDWWEYVDPTVTKELLDELTTEFLRIFDACPSRLKRRISNEKITSQSRRPHLREGTSESNSSSTAKPIPSSSASVSSIDSGLPGSSNSESSVNTQESASTGQGDNFTSSLDTSSTDLDRLGLHEINMGLPMMETSMFSLDSEYMSSTGYNPSSETKQGLPSSQSSSEHGKAGDQQGHPVKKSLREYREQKERERMKAAQQCRESAPPKPSHTATRPGTQTNQHPSSLKGNVNSPHIDQRHKEGYHGQGSQKHRPEDRHLPLDHRRTEKQSGARHEQSGNHPQSKSSGRPTDLRPNRDQRPHSQNKPHDLGGQPAHGANVTEPRYSKSTDQHHKHNCDAVQNSSDRKQHLGPNVQGKDHKRNGLESKDHGANSRLPETTPRLPSTAAPSKPHAPGSQRPHHTETPKTEGSEKVLTMESHGKPHPETPRLKPQRSETSKLPPSEKQRTQPTVPPLVPPVDATRKQRSGVTPTLGTQKVEPPQPIDHELPKPQRPERVLVQQTDTLKVNKTITPPLNKHVSSKSPIVKSPGVSKVKGQEIPKSHKPEVSKSKKTEVPRLPRTENQDAQKVQTPKPQKSDTSRSKESEVPRTQKPTVPLQLKAVKVESKTPEIQALGKEQSGTLTQKASQSQPKKTETPKKQRIKPEPGQTQRPTAPKTPTFQLKLEKLPIEKLKSPVSKPQAPVPDKPITLPSQRLATPKSKQPEASNSDSLEKAKLQKSETATPRKTNTQAKPSTSKSQRSTTPKSQGSPGAAATPVSKPSTVAETPKVAKTNAGGTSETKVVWESVKPLEVLKPGGPDRGADSESVDADIDKLINAHMAEQSKVQGLEQPLILDIKSTQSNITEPRERKRERDERSLPKSYREKESHHRKKRSEDHRSKSSPHKHHRTSDHRRVPPADADGLPNSADQKANMSEVPGESQPHSSILTTSSGIRLKIKGLSNSMNSGTSGNTRQESSPEPSRQTSSPGLVMKLNLSKMQASQANSEYHPESEGGESEKSSSHHHRHHHHHHHHKRRKHHHKSRSHHKGEDSSESYSRKRSHSRSDSVSSGGRDDSPVISSPAKKRVHNREGHSHPKSLLPSDQSLLSLPMPPMAPAQDMASGFLDYDSHSAASTGQFSYNMSEFSHNAPLTTVTALPSSDGFGFYPYKQSTEGHPPPPPPPPREELPPPPPPPPV